MKAFLLVFWLIVMCELANAQVKLDSLKHNYYNSESWANKAISAHAVSGAFAPTNLDSSMRYAKLSLASAIEAGNDSLVARSYVALGNAAFRMGNLDIALEHYLVIPTIFSEHKYPSISQAINNNIGAIFSRKEEFERALNYYLKADTLLTQLQDSMDPESMARRQSALYSNIGAAYESGGNSDLALEYYARALTKANEFDLYRRQATAYSNIGNLYLHDKKYALGETNYRQALAIYERNQDLSGIGTMMGHLGDLYFATEDYEKSREYLEECIRLSLETKSGLAVYYWSSTLQKVYMELGMYKEAYYELERHDMMKDSIFNEEKTVALTRMEMEYKFQEEKQTLESKQKLRSFWNYALGAGLIALMLVAGLVYRNLSSKTRIAKLNSENLQLMNDGLNEKLTFKNKELTTNVMYLMKKNEFINVVSSRLMAMKGKFKKENQHDINKITLDLQKAAEDDVWQEFETHFNKVHSDFYNNLLKAFPNMSLNERKLCAFLRLHLTTKEICSITHQTPNTIQVARTRLRKKLGLDSNELLVSFLEKF